MWHCVPEAGVCQCTRLGCIPPVVTQLVSPGWYSYCHLTLHCEKASTSIYRLRSPEGRASGGLSRTPHA